MAQIRIFCDNTLSRVVLYIPTTQETIQVQTGQTRYVTVDSQSIGGPIQLIGAYRGNTSYYYPNISVYVSGKGYIAFKTQGQSIAQIKPDLEIRIGWYQDPPPVTGYSYNVLCGDDVSFIELGTLSSDGTVGTQYSYPNLPWTVSKSSITSFTIRYIRLRDGTTAYADWLILRNESSFELNTTTFNGTSGRTLTIEVMSNQGYDYNFDIWDGVASFDVYKLDNISGTTTKIGTVPDIMSFSDIKRYQYIIINNIVPIDYEDTFYIYEDIGYGYQDEIGTKVERNEPYTIVPENRERYIGVKAEQSLPICGIRLGSGISSCDISFLSGEGSYHVSYLDGYKNEYFKFSAYGSDVVYINNIVVDGPDYIHPYTLTFYDSENDVTAIGTATISSGDSGSYTIQQERFFCVISSAYDGYSVRIETIGINDCNIWVNGSWLETIGNGTIIGASDTINTAKDSIIEIPGGGSSPYSQITISPHFDSDSFKIKYYRKNSLVPWVTIPFDPSVGVNFYANDNYSRVVISGDMYPIVNCFLRARSSVSNCIAQIDGEASSRKLISETGEYTPFYCYGDSRVDIVSLSVNQGEGFDSPVVLNFYPDSESEERISSTIITSGTPGYFLSPGKMYAEVSASMKKFSWYDTDSEDTAIQPGAEVSANLTATRWNKFLSKIQSVSKAFGINFDYDEVSSGNTIFARLFNGVINAINLLPHHKTMPSPTKGTGATVYAEYFQSQNSGGPGSQGYSVKDSLNSSIDYYNGE